MHIRLGLAVLAGSLWAFAQTPAPQEPLRILLDVAPHAVEYQLRRLANDELVRVERKEGDVRYRPVYMALLTRKGIGREYFDEALAALVAMDQSGPIPVLLEGLARIPADDEESAGRVLGVLLRQPADALRKERQRFVDVASKPQSPVVLRGAYGGMMVADGRVQPAWDAAAAREGHLVELLRSVPHLPAARTLGPQVSQVVAALLMGEADPPTRAAALSAVAAASPDSAAFEVIAREVLRSQDAEVRAAGVRALQRIPREAWPQAQVEPLAQSIVGALAKTPPDRRTAPATIDAVHLAELLAGALPSERGGEIRRAVRALGVQVVRITTLPEEMLFDLKWFAVQAAKPVQIVLSNPDAMPHNLLITRPGALREVGTAASTMALSPDPDVKQYVPDSPLVLQATRLLNWNETERLSFLAPKQAGEYPFVCTFPGHWVRMYGVMLVVDDIEAWEKTRSAPKDPMTDQPYTSQLNEPAR